jgi:hypothetical protein
MMTVGREHGPMDFHLGHYVFKRDDLYSWNTMKPLVQHSLLGLLSTTQYSNWCMEGHYIG